jgi:hypothetical protein
MAERTAIATHTIVARIDFIIFSKDSDADSSEEHPGAVTAE